MLRSVSTSAEIHVESLPAIAEDHEAATSDDCLSAFASVVSDDDAMYRLSRRLWTIEIHRRLEIKARNLL